MAARKYVQKFKTSSGTITEPKIENINTMSELIRVLSWYNVEDFSDKKKKKWILDYTSNNPKYKNLKKVNEKLFTHPLSTLCRLVNKGLELDSKQLKFIEDGLNKLMEHVPATTSTDNQKTNVVSIQDRMLEQARPIMSEIDFFIDQFIINDQENNIDSLIGDLGVPQTKHILNHIQKYISEFQDVKNLRSGSDDDKEYFDGYKLPIRKLNNLIKYLESLLSQCNHIVTSKKKMRAKPIRQKKSKPVSEIIKNVQVSASNDINISKLLGSQYTILFNQKYNRYTLLAANDKDGFSIKGTSISNIDDNKSFVFTIKPKHVDNVVGEIKTTTGVRKLNNIVKDEDKINKSTFFKASGRLNNNSIILVVL